MIEWDDIYKVVVAMVPLYVALMLGYGSVKWWQMFTPEQSDAINRMNCFFIMPLFTFEFTTHMDPFKLNYRFISADIISKILIGVILGICVYFGRNKKNKVDWSITGFSLSTVNNTLVLGVPLMRAMYGPLGENIVIQSAVLQSIIWFIILLFMLEVRSARQMFDSSVSVIEIPNLGKDLEGKDEDCDDVFGVTRPSFWMLMKIVFGKLARNPNSYACFAGILWACLSKRWNFEMPSIMEGSILIMSKAGSGTAMFCMGLFMASQDKLIACGVNLTLLGMVLRFIVAPLAMAIASVAVGLRGQILQIAVLQSALPQSVASFIYAKEYKLHAEVLSTAVIFGTVMSVPILIAYYATLDLI